MLSTSHITSLGLKISKEQAIELANAISTIASKFKINTPLRIKHFLGQCLHETGGLVFLSELGKPAQLEADYSFSVKLGKDLGNTAPGDGYKYRGRGLIQITGKHNYTMASKGIYGDNRLVLQPDLVATSIYNATLVSAWWWYNCNRKNSMPDGQLNYYADKDDIVRIAKTINGGPASVERKTITTGPEKKQFPRHLNRRIEWTQKVGKILNIESATVPITKLFPEGFNWVWSVAAAAMFFF